MTFGTWRWWGCQPHAPGTFTPRKCSWYSFSLGAESTPGPWYGRKEYITEKSSDTTWNRSRDRPSSALTITLPQAPLCTCTNNKVEKIGHKRWYLVVKHTLAYTSDSWQSHWHVQYTYRYLNYVESHFHIVYIWDESRMP